MNFTEWYENIKRLEEAAANEEDRSKSEQNRAKHADLITLPKDVPGTNCSNCRFVKKSKDGAFCEHEKVQLPVTPRMCCKYWDNKGVKRPWGNEQV